MEDKSIKKVIHFTHWSRNGITSLILNLISKGNKFNNYLFILSSDNEFDSYYGSVLNKKQFFIEKNKFKSLIDIYKNFRGINADVIHAHSFSPYMLAVFFSRRAKIIFHFHSEYPYLYEAGFKPFIKRLSIWLSKYFVDVEFVAVTEKAAMHVERFTGRSCIYIPNGIPDVGGMRDSFLLNSSVAKFYSVGRLDAQKNISYAVLLINELAKKGHQVIYSIYGIGPEYENIKNLIFSLNLHEVIFLKGFTLLPEILPYENDFFISPSKQEGLSLSALHGFRGNTPVITTSVGQIGVEVVDGFSGFLLSLNFDSDIQVLERLVNLSPVVLAGVQSNARSLYLQNFTESCFLERIFSLYDKH